MLPIWITHVYGGLSLEHYTYVYVGSNLEHYTYFYVGSNLEHYIDVYVGFLNTRTLHRCQKKRATYRSGWCRTFDQVSPPSFDTDQVNRSPGTRGAVFGSLPTPTAAWVRRSCAMCFCSGGKICQRGDGKTMP
jgi:hypothetical protein